MRIKSFYASTVEGAVALARRDLGSEAMLVQSRKTPIEARHLGEYEVVCAIVPETVLTKSPASFTKPICTLQGPGGTPFDPVIFVALRRRESSGVIATMPKIGGPGGSVEGTTPSAGTA